MYLYSVPESHIHFIKENELDFITYAQGEVPEVKASFFSKLFGLKNAIELPDKWPETEIHEFNPEITSNQIDLYHYLLNGSEEFVSHEGCLFQTWYLDEDKGNCIEIDSETYAFSLQSLLVLNEMLDGISKELILKRTEEFLGEEPNEEEVQMLFRGFSTIKDAVVNSVSSNTGLVWYGS